MKRNYILSSLLLTISLCSCSSKPSLPEKVDFINKSEKEIIIHTDKQIEMMNSEDIISYVVKNSDTYGKEEYSRPLENNINFDIKTDTGREADKYEIIISENEDLSSSYTFISYSLPLSSYNFKLNTTYYYQVKAYYEEKAFSSDVYSLKVKDTEIRNINVPGVINVRDLGDDIHIKQGLIYRSGQLNYDTKALDPIKSAPTELGKDIMINQLGIKTEIDLRKTKESFSEDEIIGITSSPLGDKVNYVSTPMEYGRKNIFTNPNNVQYIQQFFAVLSDINNYPIDFHCLRGTDRTGALAYVIEALCGYSREHILLDYYLSNLASINTPILAMPFTSDSFYDYEIANEEGETLKEKTMNYLINNVGVSEETLNKIIDILKV